jgi:hypothetical protein
MSASSTRGDGGLSCEGHQQQLSSTESSLERVDCLCFKMAPRVAFLCPGAKVMLNLIMNASRR